MWRGIECKATVLPWSQLVWATVYSAAARWSRFAFKIKQKARGRRFGTAKKHCTQSDMWNPKSGEGRGLFSMDSMEAVTGGEVWVWWTIPIISSPLILHDLLSSHAPSLSSPKQISQYKVNNVEAENSICKNYLWKCPDLVESWLHNCSSVITYWLLREPPKFIKWTCWVRLSRYCLWLWPMI